MSESSEQLRFPRIAPKQRENNMSMIIQQGISMNRRQIEATEFYSAIRKDEEGDDDNGELRSRRTETARVRIQSYTLRWRGRRNGRTRRDDAPWETWDVRGAEDGILKSGAGPRAHGGRASARRGNVCEQRRNTCFTSETYTTIMRGR